LTKFSKGAPEAPGGTKGKKPASGGVCPKRVRVIKAPAKPAAKPGGKALLAAVGGAALTVRVAARLDPLMARQLTALAGMQDITRSELIRQAINSWWTTLPDATRRKAEKLARQ